MRYGSIPALADSHEEPAGVERCVPYRPTQAPKSSADLGPFPLKQVAPSGDISNVSRIERRPTFGALPARQQATQIVAATATGDVFVQLNQGSTRNVAQEHATVNFRIIGPSSHSGAAIGDTGITDPVHLNNRHHLARLGFISILHTHHGEDMGQPPLNTPWSPAVILRFSCRLRVPA
jgi:hypothetical protein